MEFDFKEINIGKLIHDIVKLKNIDESRILNFFNNKDLVLDQVFSSKHINSEDLLKWSKLLKYDLFRIYSQHLLLFANMEPLTATAFKDECQVPIFRKSIYTKEIIRFICDQIINNQKTIVEVIKDYNIPKTTLHRWIKKYN